MFDNENIKEPLYSDINNVVVDNGYADQKLSYWVKGGNGQPVIASIIKPSRAQMGAISISQGEDSGLSGLYHVNGETWTVDENVPDPMPTSTDRYAYSELNAVLVNHSLMLAGFSGKKVRLATGLPFADYFLDDGSINNELIDKVKKSMELSIECHDGLPMPEIVEHYVHPESTAAWFDFAVTEDKQKNPDSNLLIGAVIVDIGGRTTDITSIFKNNKVNKAQSGTANIGVIDVKKELETLLKNKFKLTNVVPLQLEMALRDGCAPIFNKKEDVSDLVRRAKRVTSEKLRHFVEGKIGDASSFDIVLFVGGGADVLSDVLGEWPHGQVSPNPQLANSRGMLKKITFMPAKKDG